MRHTRRLRTLYGSLLVFSLALIPAAGPGAAPGDEPSKATAAAAAETFSYRLLQGLDAGKNDMDLIAAAAAIAKATEETMMPELWRDAPGWAKRIEFQWDLNEDQKPEFSLLTVQPLYQSAASRDTLFTQARLDFHRQFGQDRYTTNLGLGYRRLLLDNSVLAGINVFHDFEWRQEHSRIGFGGELKWNAFDLVANYYHGLSGKRTVGVGVSERALDGYNVELTSQLPYLPWARARVSFFDFDAEERTDDLDGYTASLEMDLLPNLQIETGFTDDDVGHNLAFVRLNFRLGDTLSTGPKGAYLFSRNPIDDQPFRARDMTRHTLDKVRRVNDIVVERTGSGITISRLN